MASHPILYRLMFFPVRSPSLKAAIRSALDGRYRKPRACSAYDDSEDISLRQVLVPRMGEWLQLA